jgi:hypothetical protein
MLITGGMNEATTAPKTMTCTMGVTGRKSSTPSLCDRVARIGAVS